MNFLAHCTLAHDLAAAQSKPLPEIDEHDLWQGLLAGAVIGDFVKGTVPEAWPRALKLGVRLHRKIDALSNQSEGMRITSDRYPPHLRRFAPIFVDLMADHCLALDWRAHHAVAVTELSAACYAAIERHRQFLSPNGQEFYRYMCERDLLAQYHDWAHIRRGIGSVLRRLNRTELMEEVVTASLDLRADARNDFAIYYPRLGKELAEIDLTSLM